MAFILNSRIKIGAYAFEGGVNELNIKKNVHCIVDTAKLTIPGLGRVVSIKSVINSALNFLGVENSQPVANNLPNSSIQTAKLFKEGDEVSIDLGYNGDLRNEFRGFVRRVNLTTPVSIDLEGYAWQLRNQNLLMSWRKTTLKEVLQFVISGTDIVLSPNIPDVPLNNFFIKNNNGLRVLEYMKTKMLLTVYFTDNELYAGLEEGRTTYNTDGTRTLTGLAESKYNIGYNCPADQPNLKQRLGKDNLVRVRLKSQGKDGKHNLYEAGDKGGSVYETTMAFYKDPETLKRLAENKLKALKYDGFEGSITGFLQPFCLPGWKATIADKRYDGARAGTYFIAGVEVTFGIRGARRKVEISYRLDAPVIK